MNEPQTLLLRETGIARLADGGEAVNVGPIISALAFLTERRGEDRGIDERGTPLPDLLSLAFDVVQSIILGGRQADYFRKVKLDFDAQSGLEGRASLALAKEAATVRPRAPSTALEKAAKNLRARLEELKEISLSDDEENELKRTIEEFRGFGVDRWVAATSHLLLALNLVGHRRPRRRAARRRKVRASKPKRRPRTAKAKPKPKPQTKARTPKKKAPKRRNRSFQGY